MRFLALTLINIVLAFSVSAKSLVLIPVKDFQETRYLFQNPSISVHFYNDNFVIATLDANPKENIIVLDKDPWQTGIGYYIVYTDGSVNRQQYLSHIEPVAEILYFEDNFLIVKVNEQRFGQLPPAKNDGMVRINQSLARLPEYSLSVSKTQFESDPFVVDLLAQVSGTNITASVQHLQNYGTRDAYSAQSVLAQQWIASEFEGLGLQVEVMDFAMPGGPASDNVIATLVGTKYPDEFVVVGGHSDSRSWSGLAPGADDNASGTGAVLEIARILSEYEFDRSIVFCAFSGEEYGLYGSAAYASRSAQQGMDILGYFNLDMIGYLAPGGTMLTTLIYPQSAQELADFYTSVCATYLPLFIIQTGTLSGGDSDHTSFNNNGYMGIFPFENANAYSPHIHTSNDIIGPSYNSEAQAVVFTKAALASVVTMANLLNPPRNLIAIPGDGLVQLQWNEMVDIDYFNIYRDELLIASTQTNYYTDLSVTNGTLYEYYVTAVYSDSGEESQPSNKVSVTPVPPIELPLFIDFENGTPYWNLEPTWGLTASSSYSPFHSLTDSPNGNYANNLDINATLDPFSLQGFTSATLSFWTKYDLETNWDYIYLEISTNGINWTQLDQFTGTQTNWVKKQYPLTIYLDEPFIQIRFNFVSDYSITRDGMNIDNFEISVVGEGYKHHQIQIPEGWSGISSYIALPNIAISNVIGPISNQLIYLSNLGYTYSPLQNIYTLENWDINSGYLIKSSENTSLLFSGLVNSNTTLDLAEGWNLIPILSKCQVNTPEFVSSFSGSIEIIKDVADNGVFWPTESINSLPSLQPGKSYFVKANSLGTIEFPECNSKHEVSEIINNKFSPWQAVAPTPYSHIISFPAVEVQALQIGDFIGAFTLSGQCAGIHQIENLTDGFGLVIYQDDELTTTKEGFSNEEVITIKLHRPSTQATYLINAEFDESLPSKELFASHGLSRVTGIELVPTSILTNSSVIVISPNPAKDYVSISLTGNSTARLEVINQFGRVVHSDYFNEKQIVVTSNWQSGLYFFRIMTNDGIVVKRVIIL